ncbi:Replicase polyprotein 1a [Liparis tanakae]|uniref:Replicase polyprotein 1a n=1 Tax=Liparis tanakae TaxID=230148 RepID=A0A4Z2HUK0_9TELE|nr:Replicase polyprotein 1a [Liparis tanakae]
MYQELSCCMLQDRGVLGGQSNSIRTDDCFELLPSVPTFDFMAVSFSWLSTVFEIHVSEMSRIRLASSWFIVGSSADAAHHLSVSFGVKIEFTDTPATLLSFGPSFFGRPGRLFGVVSWKDIESPGDLWLSAPRLVGVPSLDLLEPILGDDEADLGGDEADLPGEEADLGDEDADLGDEDADLGDEDGDLGDEDADLGDEDGDLGDEDADLGDKDADLGDEDSDLGDEADPADAHNEVRELDQVTVPNRNDCDVHYTDNR